MKILMHLCCGPCTGYPLTLLRAGGHEVRGFFYNPNIHPFQEFRRRLAAMEQLAAAFSLEVTVHRDYGLRDYLRQIGPDEVERCRTCYRMRLLPTVELALATGAEAFTTTLLYSRYQNHALIRQVAQQLADQHAIAFYYEDFRRGWQEGIDLAIRLGLYRQPYCGCIYSEQERYDRKLRKKMPASP